MELQLVSKEVAVLAKELRFDWECWRVLAKDDTLEGGFIFYRLLYYDSDGYVSNNNLEAINSLKPKDVICTLPEQELLAKWLRDVHSIYTDVIITTAGNGKNLVKSFEVAVKTVNNKIEFYCIMDEFLIYEEALEAGLLQALTLLREILNKK